MKLLRTLWRRVFPGPPVIPTRFRVLVLQEPRTSPPHYLAVVVEWFIICDSDDLGALRDLVSALVRSHHRACMVPPIKAVHCPAPDDYQRVRDRGDMLIHSNARWHALNPGAVPILARWDIDITQPHESAIDAIS